MKIVLPLLGIILFLFGCSTNFRQGQRVNTKHVEYGEHVNYEEKRPILFEDFSLTLLGTERIEAKVSVSIYIEKFLIRDHSGNEQLLEIRTVQVPPAPVAFTVGTKHFSLTNYRLPNGERLGRQQLAVFKAKQ